MARDEMVKRRQNEKESGEVPTLVTSQVTVPDAWNETRNLWVWLLASGSSSTNHAWQPESVLVGILCNNVDRTCFGHYWIFCMWWSLSQRISTLSFHGTDALITNLRHIKKNFFCWSDKNIGILFTYSHLTAAVVLAVVFCKIWQTKAKEVSAPD